MPVSCRPISQIEATNYEERNSFNSKEESLKLIRINCKMRELFDQALTNLGAAILSDSRFCGTLLGSLSILSLLGS